MVADRYTNVVLYLVTKNKCWQVTQFFPLTAMVTSVSPPFTHTFRDRHLLNSQEPLCSPQSNSGVGSVSEKQTPR